MSMILLKGRSLTIKNHFMPEAMSLSLEERNSSATVTVGPDAPAIAINDWVKDETEPGAGIIWRVKTITEQVETKTRTIQLEHVIQYLKDRVLFGETLPKDITGNKNDTECTARQAIIHILGKQSIWQLGDLCENPSNPYNFNGENLFSALETVTSSLDGAQWEYDLRSLPFTLHIRKQPAQFTSEMRMSRNITTLRKQIDRSRMYTRHYPIGKNNIHIDGDYTSKNENIWGVVAKVETDQSYENKDTLKAWSQERLNRHCEPLVTVTVTGLELSGSTGEPLDHIVVGRRCRVPLPEYGTTISERVTKMSWSDKIKEPEKVTVTLANLVEDVASIVNSQSASSSKGGRTGAKKAGEDHAWFVDTTTHVAMVAEAVAGPGAAEDWSRVSEVIVDGLGIHQRVTRTEGEIVAAWAAIEVLDDKIDMEVANAKSDMYAHVEITASHIRSEVSSSKSTLFSVIMQTATNIYTQVGNAKSDTYSKIEQTASSIRSEVTSSKSTIFSTIMQTATNIYTQVGNAKSDTYSKIEQTASSIRSEVATANSSVWSGIVQTSTSISQKVGKGEVISCINQTAEQITISASKINLSGYVTTTTLASDIAAIASLSVQSITSERGGISVYSVGTTNFTQGDVSCYVPHAIWDLQITQSGNTYTLQRKRFSEDAWTDVGSFSRATTLTGAWSSGTFTVNASPQCQSQYTALKSVAAADVTWNGHQGTFDIYAYNNGAEIPISTGKSMTVNCPADAHAITNFVTNAPSGASYGSYTNNSDGYTRSGNTVTIVVKGTWKCDGNDKEAYQYLQSTPTKIYAAGKSAADAAYSAWNSGTNSTLYYYDTSSLSYKAATGGGKKWYYKS